DLLVLVRMHLAGGDAAEPGEQADRAAAVVPDDRGERTQRLHGHAEFLTQLADEGGGGVLAGFHLPAGKLPFPAEMLPRGALAGEQAAVAVADEGGDDVGHLPSARRSASI